MEPKEEIDDIVTEDPSAEAKAEADAVLDEIDRVLDQDAVARLREAKKEQVNSNPTLSDLMREGASVSNQAIGSWASAEQNTTCALSAAVLAARARGVKST